jgi:hypothetical protein
MGFAVPWILLTPLIIVGVSRLRTKSGKKVGFEKALLVGILYLVCVFSFSYILTGSIL